MRLTKYDDNDSGVLWLSQSFDMAAAIRDSEMDEYAVARSKDFYNVGFFIRLQYTAYYDREWAAQSGAYHVYAGCVCEAAVAPSIVKAILKSTGLTDHQWASGDFDAKNVELIREGLAPTFWQVTGNNRQKLEREARSQLSLYEADPAAWDRDMQEAQNEAGATGYQWIKGDFLGPTKGMSMREMVEAAYNRQEARSGN